MNNLAKEIRRDIIEMCFQAKSGHIGGPLGSVEIYLALYFHILEEGDKVVVSNGHYSALLYSVLSKKGLIDSSELKTFRKMGGLQGHPKKDIDKGIETSSGPVGEGLGQAIGMAEVVDGQVFCLMGDGEQGEGSVWEACLLANKLNSSVVAIIDRNNCQIEGHTKQVLPLQSLKKKYEAFNWKVWEVDGHNIKKLVKTIKLAKKYQGPSCIIADTVMGKGVSFMEKDYRWHGQIPSLEQYQQAIKELS
jgi:transketolase